MVGAGNLLVLLLCGLDEDAEEEGCLDDNFSLMVSDVGLGSAPSRR